MAFVHAQSGECMKTELDLFSLPPTQTSIEKSDWIEYKPVSYTHLTLPTIYSV